MRYEHDPEKLALNVAKHGVWFHLAEEFEWETATIEVDSRRSYGETRFKATGLVGTRLYLMIFCFRSAAVRIISFRKANSREARRYADQN